MENALRELVQKRANGYCEYCRVPQRFFAETFHIEHIIAKQHAGATHESNLAMACHHCNLCKGPNIAGIESVTDQLTRLFHPRSDDWEEHFQFHTDGMIFGRTAIGRTTLNLLDFIAPLRVQLRHILRTP